MAKCDYCGREILRANGCSYKRVVAKGKRRKLSTASKLVTPVTGTRHSLVLRKKKISVVAITEPKSATTTITVATTRGVPFAEGSFWIAIV